jgi:peptide-methionine (R)-S-oxide reductase
MKSYGIFILFFLFLSCSQAQETSASTKPTVMKITDETYKEKLDKEAYSVLCGGATEAPFTGKYLYHKANGTYCCAACSNPLFTSDTKFDSGSGWPSFYNQINPAAITKKVDKSFGMLRTEILCAKCGGHLGHVFEDGPAPSGMRYCVNSLSLQFEPSDSTQTK